MTTESQQPKLSNNDLAAIALANEYCQAIELAASVEPREFTDKMIHLLPRIYMAVTDLPRHRAVEQDYSLDAVHLDEAYYDQVRENLAATLGEDDSYLETFHEDMKYSDTPIAATISEGLADLFQVLYNFVEDVKNADIDSVPDCLGELREDFANYWSRTLCNVMRPLNEIVQSQPDDESGDEEF